MMTDNPIHTEIQDLISKNNVVLFMKGTKDMPMCGFSGVVSHILRLYGLEFKDVNVLDDPEIREGVKEFANWPTIPQLYLKGEFVGGCDIIKEMHQSGEFEEILQQKEISYNKAS